MFKFKKTYKFTKNLYKIYFLFSQFQVKIIKKKSFKCTNETLNLFIVTNNNYLYVSLKMTDVKLILKFNIFKLVNSNVDKAVGGLVNKLITSVIYPKLIKLKLVGRHYRLKRKATNFLQCLLNYSHKYWLFKKKLLLKVRHKVHHGRVLICYPVAIEGIKNDKFIINTLRPTNFYTAKGVRNMGLKRFKRRGKSAMS